MEMKQKIKDEVGKLTWEHMFDLNKLTDIIISKTAKAIFEDLSRFWVGGIDENGEPVKGKREFYDFDFEELRKKWCEE